MSVYKARVNYVSPSPQRGFPLLVTHILPPANYRRSCRILLEACRASIPVRCGQSEEAGWPSLCDGEEHDERVPPASGDTVARRIRRLRRTSIGRRGIAEAREEIPLAPFDMRNVGDEKFGARPKLRLMGAGCRQLETYSEHMYICTPGGADSKSGRAFPLRTASPSHFPSPNILCSANELSAG